MKITITNKNIQNGISQNNRLCPISLALAEGGFYQPRVNPRSIYLNSEKYNAPRAIRLFTVAFDKGQTVKPFSFTTNRSPA